MEGVNKMRSEEQIKEKLAVLYDIAKEDDPTLQKYVEPPLIKIKRDSLRLAIYELLWCLDIL